MQIHEHKWPLGFSFILQPIQGHVGDDIGHIALDFYIAFIFGDKVRIVVRTLPRQNLKLVKSFGIVSKMQFPKHRRLITCPLQKLWESHVSGIERKMVINLSIHVRMLARQNGSSARCTDGIGYRRLGKQNSHLSNTINIWRFDESIIISRNSLVSMIIRHDENDIRSFGLYFFLSLTGKKTYQRERKENGKSG